MQKGGDIARQSLAYLGYSEYMIERIVHLVKVRDYPEKINDKDEILLMEADRIDRLEKIGVQRVQRMFLNYDWKEL